MLLARALAQGVSTWLLDEPTAHMDLGHRLHCWEWLRAWLGEDASRGCLLVTHDLVLAARFADELVLLERGVGMDEDGRPLLSLVRSLGPR